MRRVIAMPLCPVQVDNKNSKLCSKSCRWGTPHGVYCILLSGRGGRVQTRRRTSEGRLRRTAYCLGHEKVEGKKEKLVACSATIHHGPGHQSKTKCHVTGEHTLHEAYYGSNRQLAQWVSESVFSGYFDEPPVLSEEQ